MRVLVVGGNGFFGRGAVQGLEAGGDEVHIGSRRGVGPRGCRIDLNDPASFETLMGWEAVVNCADDALAPPDEAIASVLEDGGTWVETTADPRTLARLKERFAGRTGAGRLVLGVGIFPGVSGLLVAALKAQRPQLTGIDLAVRVSQLSGSGQGTAALMARGLEHPAVFFVNGRLQEEPTVQFGPPFSFVSGQHPTVWAGLPEPLLLPESLKLRNMRSAISPKPSFLRFNFWLLALLRPPRLLQRFYSWMNHTLLVVLRTLLMKGRSSAVELTARGDDGSWLALSMPDGMAAGGWAVAAMTRLLVEQRPEPGLLAIEQVLVLEPVLAELQRLGGDSGLVRSAAGGGAADVQIP